MEGLSGLMDESCISASRCAAVAGNNRLLLLCCTHFSAIPTSLLSALNPGYCRCMELTALPGRAIQGIHCTIATPLPPSGSPSYERQLLVSPNVPPTFVVLSCGSFYSQVPHSDVLVSRLGAFC